MDRVLDVLHHLCNRPGGPMARRSSQEAMTVGVRLVRSLCAGLQTLLESGAARLRDHGLPLKSGIRSMTDIKPKTTPTRPERLQDSSTAPMPRPPHVEEAPVRRSAGRQVEG
jgi:hypothetical protein